MEFSSKVNMVEFWLKKLDRFRFADEMPQILEHSTLYSPRNSFKYYMAFCNFLEVIFL